MSLKTDTEHNPSWDWLKWSFAAALFIAGLVANYVYNYQPWPFRLLGWLVVVAVIGVIIFQTRHGKQFLEFIRESRIELRKVYWPTRQETMQTTLVVGAMVIILALLLWGIDSVLVWLIGWLTGQRG